MGHEYTDEVETQLAQDILHLFHRYHLTAPQEEEREWAVLARQTALFRLLVERNTDLLDFSVGKKPDQRLIVKIHHLYTVAPGIAKIAPEALF